MSVTAQTLGRAGLATLFALCLAAPSQADVIYLSEDTTVTPEPGTDAFKFNAPSGETWMALRGRVVEVLETKPVSIKFVPVKVQGRGGIYRAIYFEDKPIEIPMEQVERLVHEADSEQDLWWMFSNRVSLLSKQLGTGVQIGWEPFNSYFLDAGGVPGQTLPGGPLQELIVRGGKTYKLQEGWLVNWLKRGEVGAKERVVQNFFRFLGRPPTAAEVNTVRSAFQTLEDASSDAAAREAARTQLNQLAQAIATRRVAESGGAMTRLDPNFFAMARETEIRTAVHQLLVAAARDRAYNHGVTRDKGLFYGPKPLPPSAPPGTKPITIYSDVCKHAIRLLCDLVDKPSPTAQEMGHRAREAVIQAIEAAALGAPSANDPRPAAATGAALAAELKEMSPAERYTEIRSLVRKVKYWAQIKKQTSAEAAESLARAKTLARLNMEERGTDAITAQLKAKTRRQMVLLAGYEGELSTRSGPPADRDARELPLVTSHFPVDPGQVAVIAMEIVEESATWWKPRFDEAALRSTLDVSVLRMLNDPSLSTRSLQDHAGLSPALARRITSGRPYSDVAALHRVAGTAGLDQLRSSVAGKRRPGERLARALLDLGRDGQGNELRITDQPRSDVDHDIPGYESMHLLKAASGNALEHLVAETNPYHSEFRNHVANILVDGLVANPNNERARAPNFDPNRGVRELGRNVMDRAGYADPNVMDQVVDRLFSLARLEVRRGETNSALRALIRERAVASLAHLASLVNSDRPENREIANLVFKRVENMVENEEKGFAGQADKAFFEVLGGLGRLDPTDRRPMDAHAAAFRDAYKARMETLMREDPSRAAEVRRMERELGERLGR